MTKEEIFAVAKKYYELGRCIIPSGGGLDGKSALIPWKQYQAEKPAWQQVLEWHGKLNPTVWAMPTGQVSGIFAIDCDTQQAIDFIESIGLKPHVRTSRGFHYYCKLPPREIKNSTKLLPGIDIRGQGGYVNFVGNKERVSYEVLNLPTDENLIPFEKLPAEIQRKLMSKTNLLVDNIFEKALAVAKPGNRNDAGFKLACQLRDNSFSQAEAEIVMNKYTVNVGNICSEPYTQDEAMASLKQAYSYQPREPWHTSRLPNTRDSDTFSMELPDKAWKGLFKEYRDLVCKTTEAADVFHYATFCQVLGCVLGRKLHVYHATNLYPNFYVCLVGKSGLTRKDTCWSRANDLLNRLNAEQDNTENPQFRVVKGIRSYEGLLDELSGQGKIRLIQLGELLSLLAKARQESLGNIVPQLTELYDCPDCVNPPVHQKMIDCKEPFVSIMAGTTQAWLQKALTERDIYGGFANRWMYFYGLPKEPNANPLKVDTAKRDTLIREINGVRIWANSIPSGELTISNEAAGIFANYYRQYYHRCQQDGLIPTLIVRIQDFIWKLALLYAAIEKSEIISPSHIEPAIAVGNYLELSVIEVFASFGTSNAKAQESKLLEYLHSENRPIAERDVYRRLNISAKELENLVIPLAKIGLIKNSFITSEKGRRIKTFEIN